MKNIVFVTVILAFLSLGNAYSKYGRSCKDIGCSRNEVCIMQEDPCSAYSRNGECGKYPTCKKISQAQATCAEYVCPPTKLCRVDKGEPKCFDDPAAAINRQNKQTVQSYNPGLPAGETPHGSPPQVNYPQNPSHNNNYPQNPAYNPNYPQNPASNPNYPQNPGSNPNYPQNPAYNPNYPQNPGVYPHLPGQTTPRPNVYQPGQQGGGRGYQGAPVGSGYPGYPVQGGGYPAQGGGYPGQQYPGGYNNQQGGGYPRQGSGGYANSGGYQTQGGSGYPKQGGGGYNQNQRYGKPSGEPSSNPLTDKIVDTLKTLGLFWFLVKYTVSRFYGI